MITTNAVCLQNRSDPATGMGPRAKYKGSESEARLESMSVDSFIHLSKQIYQQHVFKHILSKQNVINYTLSNNCYQTILIIRCCVPFCCFFSPAPEDGGLLTDVHNT